MTNSYKGYSNFNDVADLKLRTYNRFVTLFNINAAHGAKLVREYTEQFTKAEQLQIKAMGAYIDAKGKEAVLKEINAGLEVLSE